MNWVDTELALLALAAMMSPTTLTFSTLTLVLSARPLRTGAWFYLGALVATLAIGVVAGLVLGDAAAPSTTSGRQTWVSVFDIVAAVFLLGYVWRTGRRPLEPQKVDSMVAQMSKVTSSPWIAVVAAGAALANPGGFIPMALKTISETDPSAAQYVVDWVFFTLVSLLPLGLALVMLLVARNRALQVLRAARDWLILHARLIASVIIVLLALALLRNGISGLLG